jgi:hypothetical protein
MIRYDFELSHGFVLSLAELNICLQKMSGGIHQWVAIPVPYIVPTRDNEPRGYITIGYTNPQDIEIPNYLTFLFPMVKCTQRPATFDNLLICLHPSAAIPLSEGIYLEEGNVKLDTLEDWDRFWKPLSNALATKG